MQVYDCNIFFSYRVCTDIEVNLIVIGSQVDNKLRWLKRTKYLPLQNPQSLEIFYVHWLSFHLKQFTIANEEFIFIWQTIYDNCTHLKKKNQFKLFFDQWLTLAAHWQYDLRKSWISYSKTLVLQDNDLTAQIVLLTACAPDASAHALEILLKLCRVNSCVYWVLSALSVNWLFLTWSSEWINFYNLDLLCSSF